MSPSSYAAPELLTQPPATQPHSDQSTIPAAPLPLPWGMPLQTISGLQTIDLVPALNLCVTSQVNA